MIKTMAVGVRIWLLTVFFLTLGFLAYVVAVGSVENLGFALLAGLAALIGSVPAAVVIFIALYLKEKKGKTVSGGFIALHWANLVSCTCYCLVAGLAFSFNENNFTFRPGSERLLKNHRGRDFVRFVLHGKELPPVGANAKCARGGSDQRKGAVPLGLKFEGEVLGPGTGADQDHAR